MNNQYGITLLTIFAKNEEQSLFKTLSSTLKFFDQYTEHIIVGGDNSSYSQIEQYLSQNDFTLVRAKIKLFLGLDTGISNAFNIGILNSCSNYIMFCNSGDLLLEIPRLNKHLDILIPALIQEKNQKPPKYVPPSTRLSFPNSIVHPGSIISKNIFAKIGLFNCHYKISMDFDFFARCIDNSVSFESCESAFVVMEPSGLSGGMISFNQYYEQLKVLLNFKITLLPFAFLISLNVLLPF